MTEDDNTHTRNTLAMLRAADREGIDGAAERIEELETEEDDDKGNMIQNKVQQVVDEQFSDRVVSVEDGVVWVSGMNAHCPSVANRIAKELVHAHDIPCSLIYDDEAVKFGGVQFNYGNNA